MIKPPGFDDPILDFVSKMYHNILNQSNANLENGDRTIVRSYLWFSDEDIENTIGRPMKEQKEI